MLSKFCTGVNLKFASLLKYLVLDEAHPIVRNTAIRYLRSILKPIVLLKENYPSTWSGHSKTSRGTSQKGPLVTRDDNIIDRFGQIQKLNFSQETTTKVIDSLGVIATPLSLSAEEPNPVRGYADEAMIPITPPDVHLFDKSKIPTEAKVTKKEALDLFETMTLIRRMETEAANLYKSKQIFGFCHLYVGTEAVGTGIHAVMHPKDDVITSYRCHAWAMLFLRRQGKDGPKGVLSELAGKREGCQMGKGGSMHLFVPPHLFGGQAIVGGQVPLGIGMAFAHKYKGDGGVSFVLYGDGAANQGQVYEAFNMAHLMKLPAIFLCENNHYGMGTSKERSSMSTDYYLAGRVIPGIRGNGMDVLTVREIIREACNYCRSGAGPIIVEMDTYRYYGHSMSDPGVSYRSREEVQEVRKKKDTINKLKSVILEKNLVTEAEINEINSRIKKLCAEAKKAAIKAAMPDPADLYTQIYVKYLETPRKCTILG